MYDVTDFLASHPGGERILRYACTADDAAVLFESYHGKPPALDRPGVRCLTPATPYVPAGSGWYTELRAQVARALADPLASARTRRLATCKALLVSLWVIGSHLALAVWPGPLLGILAGASVAFAAFNVVHDASHAAYRRSWAGSLVHLMELVGLSSAAWIHQHVLQHHVFPNHSARDPDIRGQFPTLRCHGRLPWRLAHALQPVYAWILYPCIVVLRLFVSEFAYARQISVPRLIATKAAYLAAVVALPTLVHGWRYLLCWLLGQMVAGALLSVVFIISHTSRLCSFDDAEVGARDTDAWALAQLRETLNWSASGPVTLAFGGLNLQIEHHLFPGLNHLDLWRIRALVKGFCLQRSPPLPYREITFLSAVRAHVALLVELSSRHGSNAGGATAPSPS